MARGGLTSAELAARSLVPRRTINEIRTRVLRRAPAPRTVHRLAIALGVSVPTLLRSIGVPRDARRAFLSDPGASRQKSLTG